jgi:N-acetylmuramoyl-L-alanine amidase
MSRKLDIASAIALACTLGFTLVSADGSGAAAQSRTPIAVPAPATNPQLSGAPDNILPESYPVQNQSAADAREDILPPPAREAESGLTLGQLVSAQTADAEPSRELECLAGAIYFEAKSETLEGQLAVGRVIVNRSRSGRFPASYCGVVFQHSQFSFIRGSAMPAISRNSRLWKNAVAIAQIAHEGTWTSEAEGALFFHAARVSPNWHLTRIARVDSHIFYR